MAAKFGRKSRIIGSTKKCLYSASVREREEDERDGARVDAGGVPRGRQVGAASFSVAFGSVCARVARGLAQVRKADGWFWLGGGCRGGERLEGEAELPTCHFQKSIIELKKKHILR